MSTSPQGARPGDRLLARFDEFESNIVRAFYSMATAVEARPTAHELAIYGLSERLNKMEQRLDKIERRITK